MTQPDADKGLLLRIKNVLGYEFSDAGLLIRALTHRSHSRTHNERLEFLGDALLGMFTAEVLFTRFPEAAESDLTRMRSSLVKQETLAQIARQLELGDHIRFGIGEHKSGGGRKESLLANALEALIGAIYLDSDLGACRNSILKLYAPLLDEMSIENIQKDPKSKLQEYMQANKKALPAYHVITEEGGGHGMVFTIECHIEGLPEPFIGKGRNKRIAEQTAARVALEMIALDAEEPGPA